MPLPLLVDGHHDKQIKINKLNFFLIHTYPPQDPFSSPFYPILSRNYLNIQNLSHLYSLSVKSWTGRRGGIFMERIRVSPKVCDTLQKVCMVWKSLIFFLMTFLPPFQLPTGIPISSLSLVVDGPAVS